MINILSPSLGITLWLASLALELRDISSKPKVPIAHSRSGVCMIHVINQKVPPLHLKRYHVRIVNGDSGDFLTKLYLHRTSKLIHKEVLFLRSQQAS
ncbi:hypothetical protein CEXT_371061 [Caerostris extrusa]|uniref:Secreted protein n=1 Tax=Caerostris extrusa TaxID=172846 RepID=A0AAV4RIT6_CAEEX|nr:hypothetical protein CEXT_371061 [Caerostris extrusa]